MKTIRRLETEAELRAFENRNGNVNSFNVGGIFKGILKGIFEIIKIEVRMIRTIVLTILLFAGMIACIDSIIYADVLSKAFILSVVILPVLLYFALKLRV